MWEQYVTGPDLNLDRLTAEKSGPVWPGRVKEVTLFFPNYASDQLTKQFFSRHKSEVLVAD